MMSNVLATPTPPAFRRHQRITRQTIAPHQDDYLRDKALLNWFTTREYASELRKSSVALGSVHRTINPAGQWLHSTCTAEFESTPFVLKVIQYVIVRYGTLHVSVGPVRSAMAHNDQGLPIEGLAWSLHFRTDFGQLTAIEVRRMVRMELLDMLLRVGNYGELFNAVEQLEK
jgi:hypothetical protein